MKKSLKYFVVFTVVLALFYSCKKEENRVVLEGGTAPVLTASTTGPLVLNIADAAKPVIRFSWTNPNYRFNTGVSSQNVTYTLEVDTTGANFTNPLKQEVSTSNELSRELTVKDLNALFTAAKLNLKDGVPHNIEFRLKASLATNGAAPIYSNVIKMVITPYLDVAVPLPDNGTLWITGDAATSGWANPLGAPFDQNQKFTMVSSGVYELTLNLPGGGNYKLIQKQGDWSSQYHMITGGTWSGGDFEKKDADPGFPGPPTAGRYKITVNFLTGKYTVVKL
jgi:starch-binding outer membrane protein SusE/F